jgi:hypothetical protein
MKPYPNIRDLECQYGVTWCDLVDLEPRLEELLWAARQACVTCRKWSDVDRAFVPIRNTLVELVGFAGSNHWHPVLGATGAYQVAYWKLYDAIAGLLPDRAGSAKGALDDEREEKVAESCPLEPVAAAHVLAATTGWTSYCRRRWFDRTLGFWLGAAILGTAGCIVGALMPYRHPTAVTISVCWWGIFFGCFGMNIGALLGLWAEQNPASRSQASNGAGQPRSGALRPAFQQATLARRTVRTEALKLFSSR